MSDLNIPLILRLIDQVSGPAQRVLATMGRVQRAIAGAGETSLAMGRRIDSAVGAQVQAVQRQTLGIAGIGLGLAGALQPAIRFESAMASVQKVVGFDSPEGLRLMGEDLMRLTETIPMAADELAEIAAAAGQAGLIDEALPDAEKRRQLTAFAEAAAKMGSAFNISAGDAGAAMAQWRSVMGMTEGETYVYADALNYLANTMATNEAALVEITQRVGSLGQLAGLADLDFLALSASIAAAGASPEVAATGLKNFTNALTVGASATDTQRAVFRGLGLDAEEVAERMQVDAKGAILDVLEALNRLPEAKKSAALGDLFGEEAKAAIGPLLTNLDGLRDAFARVADRGAFNGPAMAIRAMAEAAGGSEARLQAIAAQVEALGAASGVSQAHLLALAAAASASGSDAAAAGEGLAALIGTLSQGAEATGAQAGALAALGLDARTLAERMREDAGGAVVELLEALNRLPEAARQEALGALFGAAAGAVAPLTGELEALRRALEKAGDPDLFKGAMDREFQVQLETTRAQMKLTRESLHDLAIVVGTVFLPAVRDGLAAVRDFVDPIRQWAQANPELVQQLGQVAAAFAGLYLGLFALRIGFIAVFGPAAALVKFLGVTLRLGLFAFRLAFMAVFGPAGTILKYLGWVLRLVGLANPFGLMIAAVIALAALIYTHWDEISAYFRDKWAEIVKGFDEGWLQGMWAIIREFNPVTLIVEALAGLGSVILEELEPILQPIAETLGGLGTAMLETLASIPRQIAEMLGAVDLYEAGLAMIRSLWTGAEEMALKMVRAIQDKLAGIVPGWMQDAWNWVSGGGEAEAAPAIAPQPPIAAPGAQISSSTTTVGDIHVHAAPGMDTRALAAETASRIRSAGGSRPAQPLHDGGDYIAP